jgi:hypothetical protein
MSATCEEAAEQLTRELGFDCHDVSPVVSVHNPLDLAHWSMPVLEVLIIAGAVFALVHAVRRYRGGDPINLALWFAPLIYLFVTEPPLYFPEWFGLDDRYGFIFAHNIFTVQFMWDRLPLYIIAIYPAMTMLAYELVRVLGIFRNRGALVGSIAVAFVCHVFYEIFDHLGPQLTWWAWNDDNVQINHPALADVPMNSMVLFASVSFGVLTYLVVRLVGPSRPDGFAAGGIPGSGTQERRTGWSLTWRIVVAGVLSPPAMAVAGIPASFFGGETPNLTAQAWVLGIELGLLWLAGAWVLVTHLQRRGAHEVEPMTPFARVYPAAYLAVMAVFFAFTAHELPIGSVLYSLACFVGAAAILSVLYSGRRRADVLAG